MFQFGSLAARSAPDFLPDEETRSWLHTLLGDLKSRLGADAAKPQLLIDPPGRIYPGDLDPLFDMICSVQEQVGQSEVEMTLLEASDAMPDIPSDFQALSEPTGKLLHSLYRDDEYLLLFSPAIFKVRSLLLANVARELGRIAIHRTGGHARELDLAGIEAESELAGIALGMGVWITNGTYVFENSCCGGGCGVDLRSIRSGLSLPEASYAAALDAQSKGLSRRSIAKHLDATQKSAFKKNWAAIAKNPQAALPAASSHGSLSASR